MLKHRVIPALLLRNGGLVKTQRFKDPKYVGDPINAIRIFNEKEVDELMVLDIIASKEKREPDYALIEQFAGECFMPLAYGGGVRTVKQAQRIFASGVEKICIQTAALDNLQLVREFADQLWKPEHHGVDGYQKKLAGARTTFCSIARQDPIYGLVAITIGLS